MDGTKASRLRMAIISRMHAEEATSVDDAEIVRTLAPCVCGSMLIEAATLLRDGGQLSAADLSTPARNTGR